jgi:hypothetical protein
MELELIIRIGRSGAVGFWVQPIFRPLPSTSESGGRGFTPWTKKLKSWRRPLTQIPGQFPKSALRPKRVLGRCPCLDYRSLKGTIKSLKAGLACGVLRESPGALQGSRTSPSPKYHRRLACVPGFPPKAMIKNLKAELPRGAVRRFPARIPGTQAGRL